MPTVQLTDQTAQRLTLLAAAWELTDSEAVDRLIDRLSARPGPTPVAEEGSHLVSVHFEYRGHRYEGCFDRRDKSLTITAGGNLAKQRFVKPSPAAAAVVHDVEPDIDPNRNGWQYWIVTATGQPLQSIRKS